VVIESGARVGPERVTRGHGLLEGYLARRRLRIAEKLIPPELREGAVLDIGCGSYPLFLASTRFREREGIDRVPEEAQERWAEEGVRLVHRDLEADPVLPYEDGRFAAVTMLAVFEHIAAEPLRVLLAEVRRVLRPGGTYVMTTPTSWAGSPLSLMSLLRLVSREEIEEHKHAYSQAEIRTLLLDAGFQPGAVRLGYFEAFMNNWAVATK
jgi:SAM-dependent methyltransferase